MHLISIFTHFKKKYPCIISIIFKNSDTGFQNSLGVSEGCLVRYKRYISKKDSEEIKEKVFGRETFFSVLISLGTWCISHWILTCSLKEPHQLFLM